MPKNERDWEIIAREFQDKWNFPHCVGAMDGKHITLQAPLNSGSDFFNYKSFFSIVLFAVVDANYNFIYANVGSQGRISDGGVFNATHFKKCFEESTLNLPSALVLPGRHVEVPFVFVGDDAFPLSCNIMKPFPGLQDKGSKTRIFNYRLSRARRVSENAFGILSSVFRILRKPILLQPETATKITLTLIHLHNYLKKNRSKNLYSPKECFDLESTDTGDITPGLWRQDVAHFQMMSIPKIPRRSTNAAQAVRNEFKEYFNSPEGDLPFQRKHN
nr:uncharacterized protein LOC111422238 [Onthophagus taurus]